MQNKKEFFSIFENTMDNFKNEDIKNKLSKTVQTETGINIDEAKKIVDNISSTIDLINDNYQDLKLAKQNGKTRTQWLRDKIDLKIENSSAEIKNLFIKEIKDSLDESNKEIGITLFGEDIKLSKPFTSNRYDELNKQIIINDFQEQIKNNTILGSIVDENGLIKIDIKHKEIQAVKEYYEEKLDSNYDKAFKTAVSVVVDIAKNKDLLPPSFKDKTPEDIAMIVDKGLTSAKVAYKVANGELNTMDAVEYMIDRNTAILNSIIVTTTTKHGGLIGGKIGATIGSIFGPAGIVAGTAIGTVVGKYAGHKVGEFINEGVRKVANVAKSVAKDIGSKISSGASSALNKLTSWFKN